MKTNTHPLLYLLAAAGLIVSASTQAQTTPVDLTEISLEDLLQVNLLSSSPQPALDPPEWTIGYQMVQATFEGYLCGTRKQSVQDVMALYPVVPTKISQQAYMLMLRKSLGNNRHLTAQIPYLNQETEHIRREGDPFTLRSEGLGDIGLGYSWVPWQQGPHRVWLNAGLRLPTGSITETGDTPRGKGTLVPYTMQLGSGTFDAAPGITYLMSGETRHVGASVNALIRLGRNSHLYSLSDRFNAALWGAQEISDGLEASIKLEAKSASRVDGADPALNRVIAPVGDPENYGGERLDLLGGLTARRPGEKTSQTLKFEIGLPVYQDLNGLQPRLELECTLYLGTTF